MAGTTEGLGKFFRQHHGAASEAMRAARAMERAQSVLGTARLLPNVYSPQTLGLAQEEAGRHTEWWNARTDGISQGFAQAFPGQNLDIPRLEGTFYTDAGWLHQVAKTGETVVYASSLPDGAEGAELATPQAWHGLLFTIMIEA